MVAAILYASFNLKVPDEPSPELDAESKVESNTDSFAGKSGIFPARKVEV